MVRKKAVLATKIDLYDGVEEQRIAEVLGRIEESVENIERQTDD